MVSCAVSVCSAIGHPQCKFERWDGDGGARPRSVAVSSTMPSHEPLDNTAEAPPLKRIKIDDTAAETDVQAATPPPTTVAPNEPGANILPPSHSLLEIAPPLQDENGAIVRLMESDVGISEYVAKDAPKIGGIIKQRCAAYIVFIKNLLTRLKVHRLLGLRSRSR